MLNKINFAIIGCGRIGNRHAEHINNYGTLKAVCDIDEVKASDLGREFGASIYTSLDELLKNESEVDVVSICTPNGLHADQTIAAFRAGFHVICEKPMAINVHDCGKMIQEAERANKRLFVVKQNRYNPPIEAVRELIHTGKLGEIYSVQLNCFWNRNPEYYNDSNWKGTKQLDGGTLFTQYSHFVDLLYFLIGDVKEVHAFTSNYNHQQEMEFEDTGVVVLKFHNNALGTINYTVNSFDKNMEGSLTIFSEKGTVKVGGQYLNELEYQCFDGFEITNLPKGNPPNQYGKYTGSMSNHNKVYENVINVLQNGGIITTNGFEGLKTVEIIEKIYNSANQ